MRKILFALIPATLMMTGAAYSQDAAAGEKVFAKCKACHVADADQNKAGPSLMNVIGRKVGTHADFNYSPAMVAAGEGGMVWNEETLTEFLSKPKDFIPKTKMVFAGLKKADEISNLIAYLKQHSAQ